MVIDWTRFWKRSGLLEKRIAHKELGIISREKCCWNSQEADIIFSVQRLHCPGVSSRAKNAENCRYTLPQMISQLTQFFALSFLSISSVIYGAVADFMWRIWEPSRWIGWTSGSDGSINCSLEKSRQKFRCRTKTLWIIKFYGNSTLNELNHFHQKAKWVDSVMEAGFMRVVKVGQYFVTKDTGNL